MGIQIAHFPTVKTLEELEFTFQPSIRSSCASLRRDASSPAQKTS